MEFPSRRANREGFFGLTFRPDPHRAEKGSEKRSGELRQALCAEHWISLNGSGDP